MHERAGIVRAVRSLVPRATRPVDADAVDRGRRTIRTAWVACAGVLVLLLGAQAGAAEVCGDGRDNDGNGLADEGCYPSRQTGVCASPLSCLDTGWVSWSTGSLRYDLPADVAPQSPYGPAIGVRRIYTSQYEPPATPSSFNRTPLGPRWQHNYMSWVDRQANGELVIHTPQGEDVLVDRQTALPQRGHYVFAVYLSAFTEVITLDFDHLTYDAAGELSQVSDRFGMTVRIAWTTTPAGRAVSTVTDATLTRRLRFEYDTAGLLTSVKLEYLLPAGWTHVHTTTYAYAGGALASVTVGGQLAQRNVYSDGYLSRIDDGEGRRLAAFRFASARPGQTRLIETADGSVGFDFDSSRAVCQAETVVYFNKANENSCSTDADCGTGALCGGTTGGPGATGTCFRGARCLTVDESSGQSLVTAVSAIGPPSETCTGACAEVAAYVWNPSTLDLVAVRDTFVLDAFGTSTTTEYNAYGQPTKIVYADTDENPQNGGGQRTVYLTYSGPFLDSVKSRSAVWSNMSGTRYVRDPRGALLGVRRYGYRPSEAGVPTLVRSDTSYTYDLFGRVTSVDGPLDGDLDQVLFAYHDASAGPMQNGFLSVRSERATIPTLGTPIAEVVLRYDYWGNPVEWEDYNGQRRCAEYDSRNVLKKTRVAMTGAGCVDDAADLVESYEHDSALRPTRVKRSDGSCTLFEYDGRGRLARATRRDDCEDASPADRIEYRYDADGLLIERATYGADGTVKHRSLATYHDSRRLNGVPNPVDPSKVATIDYDQRGVVTALNSEQNLGRTQFEVDDLFQVRSVSRFRTPTVSDKWKLDYDVLGRRTMVTDPDGKALVTTYDDLGRPVRQVSPDETSMNVDRTFNPLSLVEAETSPMQTRRFTYDPMGRLLTANYDGHCGDATLRPEVEHRYDGLGSLACPNAAGCHNLKGRLAHTRITLTCSSEFTDDGALDQQTFYSYDAAGRLVGEYIRDDRNRVADQTYAWTKGGALALVELPSSTTIGWTHGGPASTSDTDRVTAVWRNTAANTAVTPIVDNVLWNPFGPLKQYDRKDKISGSLLRMRIERNLAYRVRSIQLEGQTFGGPYYRLLLTEDAKGRVTSRDYYPSHDQMIGVFDSFYLYDDLDRVVCETTTPVTTCPTSGSAISTIKNNHYLGFTGAGDRSVLLRPVAGSSGGLGNVFTLFPFTHRIESVAQPGGATPLGTTAYSYDAVGRRSAEDNPGPRTSQDRRSYTYDGRGNLVGVRGTAPIGGTWRDYYVESAFDARNRRVFKAVHDLATAKQQHWFFYYDAYDRLTEVRHLPDASVPATSTTYQLIWLEGLLVAYWQTDAPSGATSKRYVSFDETGRPVRMHSWTNSNSIVTWAINPDAWGMDTVVIGPGVYQPVAFAGQYVDAETASYLDDGTTRNRPGLVLNGFRTYDPFTGSYLQVDPRVHQTWDAYGYADGNPVGKQDPRGLESRICRPVSISEWFPGPDGWPQEVIALHEECWGTGPGGDSGGSSGSAGGGGTGSGGAGGGGRPDRPPKPPRQAPEPKDEEPGPDADTCKILLSAIDPMPIFPLGPETRHRSATWFRERQHQRDAMTESAMGAGEAVWRRLGRSIKFGAYSDCVKNASQ
jgi:RHS repeat-associated protein